VDVDDRNLPLLPVNASTDGVGITANEMTHPRCGCVEAAAKRIQRARGSLVSEHVVESRSVQQIDKLVEALESLTIERECRIGGGLAAHGVFKLALNPMDHKRQVCSGIVRFGEAKSQQSLGTEVAERPHVRQYALLSASGIGHRNLSAATGRRAQGDALEGARVETKEAVLAPRPFV
jgi:hypothetical protein